MIAHLKDQLQEMKAKTSMEGKYIKKDAEVCLLCASFFYNLLYPIFDKCIPLNKIIESMLPCSVQ